MSKTADTFQNRRRSRRNTDHTGSQRSSRRRSGSTSDRKINKSTGSKFDKPSGSKFNKSSGSKFDKSSGSKFDKSSGSKFDKSSGSKFNKSSDRSPSASTLRRQAQVKRQRIILIVAAIILSIIVLVIGIRLIPGPDDRGQAINVSDSVLQYRDAVAQACVQNGISEYSELMLAIMQQESGGEVADVFQCSESPFNTVYENYPNAITDPYYSIEVGAETFAYCLKDAKCRRLSDTGNLYLAIQEYNFGNNYASWAKENYGGHSEDCAWAFSYMMAAELGWDAYGDPAYVSHVLQYFSAQ